MIDVSEKDLLTIKSILEAHVPDYEVRAFGSRASWTAKDYSDLDLVVVGSDKLESRKLDRLKEALEESSLPFRVDVLDWHCISPEFKRNIEKSQVVIKSSGRNVSPDWRYFKVSEFAEVIGGGTPKTGVEEYWNGTIPWVTPKDLSDHQNRYISHGERNITEEGLKNSSARIVPADTVLLTSRAPVGYLAMARNPLTTNQGFRSLIIKEGFSAEFIYYLLLNNVEYLKQHASGSTFQELSGGTLRNLQFRVPDLATQKKIAKILSDLDEKIELNHQMNETLEAIAQALFKRWFVDFEFPDKNGKSYKSLGGKMTRAELGEIPRGWLLRSLYECADYINGSSFRNEDFSVKRQGLPIIKIGELKSGISDQTMFTDTILEKKYRIVGGDTLFSWSGSPDTSIDIFIWAGSDGWLNQHIFKIQFKREEDKYFVYFLLKYFKPIFIETARNKQTTGLGHVTGQDLKRLKTVFPSDDVLKAFNKTAEPLFQKIFNNLSEANVLMDLRDSLLPKLMLGQKRVIQ